MLRFIYIKDQIEDGGTAIAFYDTVTDRFVEYQGVQVFDDWDDFCEYYESDKYPQHPLDRFFWSCHTTS
jgi:hypothetical protein